jgi:hypothetical protein
MTVRNARVSSATRARLVACVFVLSVCACQSSDTLPRTEILLQVDADSEVRAQAQRLTVALASGGASAETLTETDPEVFDLTAPDFHWPASLALVAKAGHENHVFEATITAEADGSPLARGRVRSAFLKGQTLLLTTSLFGACIGMFDCQADETCVSKAGKAMCVSAVVDEMSLPVFVPGADAGGDAADSGVADAGHPPVSMMDSGNPPEKDAAVHDSGSTSDAGTHPPSDSGASSDGAVEAGGCVPTSQELCFNGVDDDCNGKTDCADSACMAGAMCAPAASTLGVLVSSGDPCPSGYGQGELLLHQGLTDNGCSGCSCQSTPTTCSPHVYYYATTSACTGDVAPYSGGTLLNPIPSYTCSSSPIGDAQSMDTPVAWRVTMGVSPSACTASGAASALPPAWSTTMKLCTRTTSGGGCSSGFACVPKVAGAKTCSEKAGAVCPTTTNQETWQRGFSDNRSCGGCACTAAGGNCSSVAVQLGHDWGCGTIDGSLHGGEKSCSISTYAPPAILSGLPTNPTCSVGAPVNGTLTATQPLDLCCVE